MTQTPPPPPAMEPRIEPTPLPKEPRRPPVGTRLAAGVADPGPAGRGGLCGDR